MPREASGTTINQQLLWNPPLICILYLKSINQKEMKKQLIVLMSLTLGLTLTAQSFGEIKGRVIEAGTGEPVMFASVFIEQGGTSIGGYTDEEGRFRVKPLEPGTYDLNVKCLGYQEILHQGVVVKTNEITILSDFKMQSGMEFEPVIVTTYTIGLITMDDPSKMSIGGTDLQQRADVRDTQSMIVSLIPGVTKGNGPEQQLHFRGARPQNFATFVDGVRIGGGVIPSLPSNAINNLTVYTGGIPAKYGDVTGGVIIIDTKGYFDFYRESQRKKRNEG